MAERPGMKSEATDYLATDIAAETIDVSARERAVFRALWLELYRAIPDEGVTWLSDRIARAGIPVSIQQIQGFSQFTAQVSEVATSQSTASTSYTDLATVGPELTGLPDGKYVLFFGSQIDNPSGAQSLMSVQVNAAAANDTDSILVGFGGGALSASCSRALLKDLDGGGNNTVTAKYRVTSGTGTFVRRFLIALKYSNL